MHHWSDGLAAAVAVAAAKVSSEMPADRLAREWRIDPKVYPLLK